MTITALLAAGAAQLAHGDEGLAEAEFLLAEVLGISRGQLRFCAAPNADQQQLFYQWLAQRAQGIPFAYVVGNQPFRKLSFTVDQSVLIPRPETELLVDWALELLDVADETAKVIDVGTGSGCIALSIAHERPKTAVLALDISLSALATAQANADRLGIISCEFRHSDLLDAASSFGPAALIVSNPPYISEGDHHLPALIHEPITALTSGPDGLSAISRLCHAAPQYLCDQGWLLMEHGFQQGSAVRQLLATANFSNICTRKDYGGHERLSAGQWRPQ